MSCSPPRVSRPTTGVSRRELASPTSRRSRHSRVASCPSLLRGFVRLGVPACPAAHDGAAPRRGSGQPRVDRRDRAERPRPGLRSAAESLGLVVNVIVARARPAAGRDGAAVATVVGGVAAAIWNLSVLNRVYGVPWTSMLGVRRSDIVLMVDTAKRLIRRSQPQRDLRVRGGGFREVVDGLDVGEAGAVMLLCFRCPAGPHERSAGSAGCFAVGTNQIGASWSASAIRATRA